MAFTEFVLFNVLQLIF